MPPLALGACTFGEDPSWVDFTMKDDQVIVLDRVTFDGEPRHMITTEDGHAWQHSRLELDADPDGTGRNKALSE